MDQPKRRGRFLWDGLNRGTAWVYRRVGRSPIGRLMTGYRRAEQSLGRGLGRSIHRNGRHACHPMSPARLRLLEAVEAGRLFAGLRGLFAALFACPAYLYGLFGVSYGMVGVGLYIVSLLTERIADLSMGYLVLSALFVLLSLPLAVSRRSLADTLGGGRFSRLVLVTFLGIPPDRLSRPRGRTPAVLTYLFILLGLGGGVAAYFVGLWVIPLCLFALSILGLIFTYPEAGVVLSTVFLPVIWLDNRALWVLAGLILLTWCSFALKLLFLHRSAHVGLLDGVILLFGVLLLLSGLTGAVVNADTVLQGLLLFVCLSDYFLIVNLMTTRAYIRRCLLGVAVSVGLVTLLSYLRQISVDELGWLAGSRGGDALIDFVGTSLEHLSELWVEQSSFFLVLVFPWLYALTVYAARLRHRILWLALVALDLFLVLMGGSISGLLCVLCGALIFLLLLDHRWLSATLVSLPAMATGGCWLLYFHPPVEAAALVLSRSLWYRSQLHGSLWQMVLDHPAGIGFGEACFSAVYPAYATPHLGAVTDFRSLFYEVLLGLGWAGLAVFVLLLFLFFQKGFTALRHTSAPRDRAMILGGIASLAVTLIFGTVRSFISAPRVFFTVLLVIALCSAYENVLFDESDVLSAEDGGSPREEDRIYRQS